MTQALKELVDLVAAETGALTATDADEESVGWSSEGPLPMTFGHVRRAVAELAAIPARRGGLEPNWWEEWVKTTRAYNALAKAAQAVVEEAKAIHDNDPWPIRYRAPYEAITKLSEVLEASDKSVAVAPSPLKKTEVGHEKP